MEDFFKLAYSTLILRPYVFAFLAAYLFIAYLFFGWRRVLVFTLIAWIIAFLSEYSSINNGFPYGFYEYTYLTQVKAGTAWAIGEKEFYLFGVIPFIDSLSYTFLTFIGYGLSIYYNSPVYGSKLFIQSADTFKIRHSLKTAFIGAILVTFMDVIIDPVATMGSKWFLGEIHRYVYPGHYFGVPVANYLGWFFTSFLIIFVFQRADSFLVKTNFYIKTNIPYFPLKISFLLLFYMGVVGFNLYITYSLNEVHLLISGILIEIPILLFLIMPMFQKHHQVAREEMKAHHSDFPSDHF